MCFHSKQSKSATELQNRFKAAFADGYHYEPTDVYNGFTHPTTPIITNIQPHIIQAGYWGLIPQWASMHDFKANTLNAKIETLSDKPSFRPHIQQRCLILADGFYEWQWIDPKGKNKQAHLITLDSEQAYAYAGIYSDIVHPDTGELIRTYTIITTKANELMSIIHNTKQRMPIILQPEEEEAWLSGQAYMDFASPKVILKAKPFR